MGSDARTAKWELAVKCHIKSSSTARLTMEALCRFLPSFIWSWDSLRNLPNTVSTGNCAVVNLKKKKNSTASSRHLSMNISHSSQPADLTFGRQAVSWGFTCATCRAGCSPAQTVDDNATLIWAQVASYNNHFNNIIQHILYLRDVEDAKFNFFLIQGSDSQP